MGHQHNHNEQSQKNTYIYKNTTTLTSSINTSCFTVLYGQKHYCQRINGNLYLSFGMGVGGHLNLLLFVRLFGSQKTAHKFTYRT